MYCIGHLDRGFEDILDPWNRTIGFGDGPAQVLVVDTLRYLWIRPAGPGDDVKQYMKSSFYSTTVMEEREKMPETLNLDVDSQWKLNIYYAYNHLFSDVSRFLPSVNCAMGHFHPPNASHFPIIGRSAQKTFDTNVLIMPAYLVKDWKIEVSTVDEFGAKMKLGSFDMAERHTVLFLKRDMAINIELTSPEDQQEVNDLSAVMVVGKLCTDDHDRTNRCAGHGDAQANERDQAQQGDDGTDIDEDDDDEEQDIAAEVQSSMAMVMLMYQQDQQRRLAEGRDAA